MSSNAPTLPPPNDPLKTQIDLRQLFSEIMDEKLKPIQEQLNRVEKRLGNVERELADFRVEMRRSIADVNRAWKEQNTVDSRLVDHRLTEIEDRVAALESQISQA